MTPRAGSWAVSAVRPDAARSPGALAVSLAAHAALALLLAWVGARTLDQPAPPQAIDIVLEAPPSSPDSRRAVPTSPPPADVATIAPTDAPPVPPQAAPPAPPDALAPTAASTPEPQPRIAPAPLAPPSVAAPPPPAAIVIPEEPSAAPPPDAISAPRPAPPRVAAATAPHPAPPRPAASRPTSSDAGRTAPSLPPAQAAPAPPAAPSLPASGEAITPAWRGAVGAWLESHKVYPEAARRRGEEGVVGLRFTVDRTGQVLDSTVEHGSGSDILDRVVRTMLQGARLPPFPASMTQAQVTLSVPVRFRLEQP